jgi:general secretion pathway protein D
VPILSSIPFLGPLFTQKTSSKQKKNLMVFIKPVIMRDSEDAMSLSYMKYGTMRSIQANYTEDLASIGEARIDNRMPPWKNTKDLPVPFEAS